MNFNIIIQQRQILLFTKNVQIMVIVIVIIIMIMTVIIKLIVEKKYI